MHNSFNGHGLHFYYVGNLQPCFDPTLWWNPSMERCLLANQHMWQDRLTNACFYRLTYMINICGMCRKADASFTDTVRPLHLIFILGLMISEILFLGRNSYSLLLSHDMHKHESRKILWSVFFTSKRTQFMKHALWARINCQSQQDHSKQYNSDSR